MFCRVCLQAFAACSLVHARCDRLCMVRPRALMLAHQVSRATLPDGPLFIYPALTHATPTRAQGGAAIYALRWPERLKPGAFDVAFHSHQVGRRDASAGPRVADSTEGRLEPATGRPTGARSGRGSLFASYDRIFATRPALLQLACTASTLLRAAVCNPICQCRPPHPYPTRPCPAALPCGSGGCGVCPLQGGTHSPGLAGRVWRLPAPDPDRAPGGLAPGRHCRRVNRWACLSSHALTPPPGGARGPSFDLHCCSVRACAHVVSGHPANA